LVDQEVGLRAYILEQPAPVENRPLECIELPIPRPGPGQIQLKVRCCGICRTDLHVVEGELPPRRRPVIPGHQVVGEVAELGEGVTGVRIGERRGVAWLHSTCGRCRFCASGRENLCEQPEFTGWTRDGGFAEVLVAEAEFTYPIPEGFPDLQAAPLLCAGIIGFRALEQTGLGAHPGGLRGARLGLYGFGAAGHVVIQLARARGAEVYVMTRDQARHQALATELGAAWVGGALDPPPVKLDASIIFAPAGEIVPPALCALDKGGVLVLGGIHMSPTPPLDYALLYEERQIRSVANNTREDGRALLDEAAQIPIATHVQAFPFEQANEALIALKNDAIKGAGVLVVSG
jgi:propanol-preferring alcohol dehydrogenase